MERKQPITCCIPQAQVNCGSINNHICTEIVKDGRDIVLFSSKHRIRGEKGRGEINNSEKYLDQQFLTARHRSIQVSVQLTEEILQKTEISSAETYRDCETYIYHKQWKKNTSNVSIPSLSQRTQNTHQSQFGHTTHTLEPNDHDPRRIKCTSDNIKLT